MKQNAWEWDESDLRELITLGVQESLELDYKRCESLQKADGKKNEISKDVSAFANSAGGILVYGMVENGHVPTAIDVGYDPNDISKEWLEQVINSRIQRRIDGVRVTQVALSNSAPGKVAYVVFVPQSTRAPHQAFDKKFYKRFNFESVAMEEYEIRDVARRAEGPDLRFAFLFNNEQTSVPLTRDPGRNHRFSLGLFPVVSNESPSPAEYINANLMFDSRIKYERYPVAGKECHREILGNERAVREFRINWNGHGNGHVPLLQGVPTCIIDGPFILVLEQIPNVDQVDFILGAELRADRMEPRRFAFSLRFNSTLCQADIRSLAP